jgi:hypothetical protein
MRPAAHAQPATTGVPAKHFYLTAALRGAHHWEETAELSWQMVSIRSSEWRGWLPVAMAGKPDSCVVSIQRTLFQSPQSEGRTSPADDDSLVPSILVHIGESRIPQGGPRLSMDNRSNARCPLGRCEPAAPHASHRDEFVTDRALQC